MKIAPLLRLLAIVVLAAVAYAVAVLGITWLALR